MRPQPNVDGYMRTTAGRSTSPKGKVTESAPSELAAIYDQTVDDIYRFCVSRGADIDLSADITAEVFFAAARVFAEGSGHNVDRPWLFTVAKNRLTDHWRSSARHDRRIKRLQQWMTEGSRGRRDLSDELEVIVAADVVDALHSLPDRQRAALTLRYLEEQSVAEVADALAVEYQAAESLLARARRSFERAWTSRTNDGREQEQRP